MFIKWIIERFRAENWHCPINNQQIDHENPFINCLSQFANTNHHTPLWTQHSLFIPADAKETAFAVTTLEHVLTIFRLSLLQRFVLLCTKRCFSFFIPPSLESSRRRRTFAFFIRSVGGEVGGGWREKLLSLIRFGLFSFVVGGVDFPRLNGNGNGGAFSLISLC